MFKAPHIRGLGQLFIFCALSLYSQLSPSPVRAEGPSGDEPQEEGPREEDDAPAEAHAEGPSDAALNAKAIVITFDGGFVDAGFAGDKAPRFSDTYHLADGRISNWGNFEALLTHIFKQLGVSPSQHPVLLSETVGTPRAEHERLTQLMFEKFNVPAFYLAADGVLACYAAGRTTCLAITGQAATDAVAVYEGYALPHSRTGLLVGRVDVAQLAMKLIGDRIGQALPSSAREGVWQLLEQHGYVALNYDAELQKAQNTSEFDVSVELPGGQTATLGMERFAALEALFKASLAGGEGSLQKAVYDAIMLCDVDVRGQLYANIVPAGRALAVAGVTERLTHELRTRAPPSMSLRIVESAERAQMVWIGGSIVSSLPTFKQMWVTRKDYDTSGPSIIGKKAF